MYVNSPQTSIFSPSRNLGLSRSTNDSSNSPYLARVKNINKKVTYLNNNVEEDSPMKRADQLEAKIRQVDHRITTNYHTTEEMINDFTAAVNDIEENLAADIISRELLEERKVKEMRLVESNIVLALKSERHEAKEVERRVLNKVEQNVHAVKGRFAEEQRKMDEFRKEQTETIEERLGELHKSIKEERTVREQTQTSLAKNVSNKLSQFQDTLDVERKKRNQTENYLLKQMEDVCSSLQNQVNNDREKREQTEAEMLALLEEVCNKFEGRVKPAKKRSGSKYRF